MEKEKKNSLLKIDNFLVESDKINTSDETFNKLMFLYSAGLKELENKFDIIKEEFKYFYSCDIINHTQSRIKKPESIIKKLENKNYDITYRNLIEQINDIAGLRIICPIKEDIFTVVDIIKNMPDINIIKEKDYVTKPKKSGYSSYHIIVEVPVQLFKQIIPVKVEIQIRTMAMDFWATLEHDIKYKSNFKFTKKMSNQLVKCAKMINKMDDEMVTISKAREN
ncbi:MAG: GTP pyrophosphokinase family protein [Clostridia bacterium]|nr:GTP pyrophosphokinase family protein [Clostridia bacterium]